MTQDDDFSRELRNRLDAVGPAITVDTSRVISRARRRLAVTRTAGALTLTLVLGGSGWALNAQPWHSPAAAPAGQVLPVAGKSSPTQSAASDTLGLNLTATPTSKTGAAVPAAALAGAIALLEQRLSTAGITDARVIDNGNGTIFIGLSKNPDQKVIDLVSRPVELATRPVLAVGAPGPADVGGNTPAAKGKPDSPSDSAYYATADVLAAYAELDCTVATSRQVQHTATDAALVACDATGTAKYILGPVEIPGSNITVPSQQDPAQARTVLLQFTSAGTAAFREMTTRLQGLTSPQNRAAIVLDGVVISSPTVAPGMTITDGKVQIHPSEANGNAAAQLAGELLLGTLTTTFQIDNAGAIG
jgi:preprotein translocase subunit SecD